MRRFLRPIVIAVAALGLALGAGVGLAAPALADDAFTATLVNGPIQSSTSTEVDFAGAMSVGTTVTGQSDFAGTFAACTYPTTTSWACVLTPTSTPLTANGYSAEFTVVSTDGTTVHSVLSFQVYEDNPYVTNTPNTPVVNYQFTPVASTPTSGTSGATVTVAPSNPGGPVTYESLAPVEDDALTGCPDYPTDPSASLTCNYAVSPGASPESDGQIYVNDAAEAADDDDGPDINQEFIVLKPTSAPTSAVDAGNDEALVSGAVPNFAVGTGIALDVFNENGAKVCSTTSFGVDEGVFGDWSCQTSDLGAGTHQLYAVLEDVSYNIDEDEGYHVHGALSPESSPVSITFPAAPAGPTGGSGGTGDTTPTWSFTIGGDLTDVHPGDTLDISGSGLPAGTSLDTILHSVPTDLGTVVAAADGTFDQTVTVPADTELGDHTIMVTASGPGIVTTTKQQAITVTAVPATTGSSGSGKSDATTTKPTATHGAGVGDPGTGIAPNILTRALTPIADVAVHPNKIISAFEIGLVLLLLAVLPAHLLNATIAEQSDRFERRFPTLHMPRWLTALAGWFRSAPVVGGIVVTLATAILFGFADPTFGFTLASLRLILACGIALFLVGYVANALTGLIARVQWNIVAAVSTRPYGLILTIVGVLISRLLHFSPGFLIGLILGLTIQGKSAAGFAWRTVVLRSSIVLIMAIAAWIGYSTLTLGGNEGGTFGSALLVETLVAITTEGVVALLVELLPLRFLEGERVYAHSKVLWGIFYVLTLVVFVLAVIPWEGNWDALGSSLWIWIGVLAIFAAVCVGVYIYFRRFAPPLEEEAGSERVALGETVAGDRS